KKGKSSTIKIRIIDDSPKTLRVRRWLAETFRFGNLNLPFREKEKPIRVESVSKRSHLLRTGVRIILLKAAVKTKEMPGAVRIRKGRLGEKADKSLEWTAPLGW
ncbi:MAG: hypothetical protein ACLFMP_01885, partial [Desulfonatronovibrionaceae bacterium]